MNEIINTGGTVSNSSLTVLTLKHESLISMYSSLPLNYDARQQTGGGSPTSKCRCVRTYVRCGGDKE